MAKRTAEAGAGLVAATHAGALLDHVDALADYRKRVKDAHAAGQEALGLKSPPGDDEMGSRIFVTGDVYGDEAVRMIRQATANGQAAEPSPAAKEPSLLRKMLPYVLTAAMTAGGLEALPLILGGREPVPSAPPTAEPPAGFDVNDYFLRIGR